MRTAFVSGKVRMHGGFGRVDRQPIHHLDGRRHDAAGDDRRHRVARRVDRREPRKQREHRFWTPEQAQRRLRDDGERAFRADEDAEQIEAGRVERGAADVDELAVGQHGLDAEHVVDGEAVLQAVRAAGVLGDVAADRADDSGSTDQARSSSRTGATRFVIVQVGDARFDDDAQVGDVDVENAVQSATGRSGRRPRCGSAPPDSPVPLTARHERHAVAVAETDDGLHFLGRRRQHDGARRRSQVDQGIGLVRQEIGRILQQRSRRYGLCEFVEKIPVHRSKITSTS